MTDLFCVYFSEVVMWEFQCADGWGYEGCNQAFNFWKALLCG